LFIVKPPLLTGAVGSVDAVNNPQDKGCNGYGKIDSHKVVEPLGEFDDDGGSQFIHREHFSLFIV